LKNYEIKSKKNKENNTEKNLNLKLLFIWFLFFSNKKKKPAHLLVKGALIQPANAKNATLIKIEFMTLSIKGAIAKLLTMITATMFV
jgi:hypothetical protein